MTRHLPDRPLPPYAYVRGRGPHPLRDPRGHSYEKGRGRLDGSPTASSPPLDPARSGASAEYLYGIDLFNHGFFWEAHEVWESLWNAAGRAGDTAELLRGLIKFAAAALKIREGAQRAAGRFATEAGEHIADLRTRLGRDTFAGLDLAAVARSAARLDADREIHGLVIEWNG